MRQARRADRRALWPQSVLEIPCRGDSQRIDRVEIVLHGSAGHARAIGAAELTHRGLYVATNREHRDPQRLGDLLIGPAAHNQAGDIELAEPGTLVACGTQARGMTELAGAERGLGSVAGADLDLILGHRQHQLGAPVVEAGEAVGQHRQV